MHMPSQATEADPLRHLLLLWGEGPEKIVGIVWIHSY